MRERRWSRGMWAGDSIVLTPEDLEMIPGGLDIALVDLALGIPVMHTVSVTVVVPKSACVRRMVPEIGTGGEGASVAVRVVIVISVKAGLTARWREKRKGSRVRLPLLLLPTMSCDVKVWELGGEEVVGAAPGRREGSDAVIRFAIVEGSVWTRDVHDFVSSVATEERVAVVQKREVEGRGIVQEGTVVDEGGGG